MRQGDRALLNDPVAKDLLGSTELARLSYSWLDGSPRVVPIWFHWTGEEIVMGTPPKAPKVRALRADPRVAITIDTTTPPNHVLLVRGVAQLELVDGVAQEYAAAAERYMGPDAGSAWVQQIASSSPNMWRVAVRPEWVGIIDFETRFPSALAG